MKKTVIAIAVAAALLPAAAMADAMVYGKLHLSVESQDNGTTSSSFVSSNSSRLGVKASTDLDNGLTGLLQLEGGIAPGNISQDATMKLSGTPWGATRDSYLGVKGGFGTVLVGRLPAANQYVYDSNVFADQLGDAGNFNGKAMPGRADNALHYVSPDFGPISVALTHVMEQGVPNMDANGVRVSFAQDGISAAITYFKLGTALANTTNNFVDSVTAISAGYNMGDIGVSGILVNNTGEGGVSGADRLTFTVGATMKAGSGKAKVQFSSADEGAANANDGATMVAVGYDMDLAKNVSAYVVYASVSNKAGGTYHPFNWGHGANHAGATPVPGKNASGFGAGMIYNF